MPNRSKYIHWIEDLLSSDIIPNNNSNGDIVRGFDKGTGANCIYPLLGASLLGWTFVGSGSFFFPFWVVCGAVLFMTCWMICCDFGCRCD